MFLQIVVVILFTTLQDVTPQSSQLLPLVYLRNQPEANAPRVEDTDSTGAIISPSLPQLLYSSKDINLIQEDPSSPAEKPPLFGKGPVHKRRRDVPNTSYSRSGDDGETAFNPSLGGVEKSTTLDETFRNDDDDDDSSVTETTTTYSTTTVSDTSSSTSDSPGQELVPSEETGHAIMQGQFSFMAPGGNIVNTTWTADEKGIHVKAPTFSIFGFGRRR